MRARKRRDNLAVLVANGVPSAVVEVQVRVDDDVDILGRHASRGEIVEQLGRLSVELDHSVGEFVAHACLDQDRLFAAARRVHSNQQRVQAGDDAVLLIGRHSARPHDLGNDAEERAAVEYIGSIGKSCEFEVAEIHSLHESSLPQQTLATDQDGLPRIRQSSESSICENPRKSVAKVAVKRGESLPHLIVISSLILEKYHDHDSSQRPAWRR